jgi:uncharacterized protein (DUF1684 family)
MRLLFIPLLAAAALAGDPNYTRDVDEYRAQREATLKKDDGWLTVVGLYRLKEGDNRVGSGEPNEIDLPAPAPAKVGKITFSKGQAIYYSDGKPGTLLRANLDVITIGAIKFFVIKRGEEYFIRVRDNNSKIRRDFTGLKWFPIDPSWKIDAKLTAYDKPRTILFDSQNGVKQPMESPGYGAGDGRPRAVLRVPRRDEQQEHLWCSAVPLRDRVERWLGDSRFQQGDQSAVRVHGVCDVSSASATESVDAGGDGGGKEVFGRD